jgi:hypothetical protein
MTLFFLQKHLSWFNFIPMWFINVGCPWITFAGLKPVWALSVTCTIHFSPCVDKIVPLSFGDVSVGMKQSKDTPLLCHLLCVKRRQTAKLHRTWLTNFGATLELVSLFRRSVCSSIFLGAFTQLRKTTISFMSVRSSVRMEQLGSHCTNCNEM